MLLEPRWDEEAMELAKTRMRESIHQSVTTPKTIARNVFRRMIYGPDNVLSRSVWRSEESIHSIQLEDLKEFYTNIYLLQLQLFVLSADIPKKK